MAMVIRPGRAIGKTSRAKVRRGPAPSTNIASYSSLGMSRSVLVSTTIDIGSENAVLGRIIARRLS